MCLPEVDEELVAIELPHVLHVTVTGVSLIHEHITMIRARPAPAARRVRVPVDLVTVLETLTEEFDFVAERGVGVARGRLAFRRVRRSEQMLHLLPMLHAGKELDARTASQRENRSHRIGNVDLWS